jgi:predicted Zn-dependent peptidase
MSMEDEPRQRLGKVLRQYSYAAPWGNSAEGELATSGAISIADVRSHYAQNLRPDEAILGIAGNVDPEQIRDAIEACFGHWKSCPFQIPGRGKLPQSPCHIEHDSAQTHIGLAWETVPYSSRTLL